MVGVITQLNNAEITVAKNITNFFALGDKLSKKFFESFFSKLRSFKSSSVICCSDFELSAVLRKCPLNLEQFWSFFICKKFWRPVTKLNCSRFVPIKLPLNGITGINAPP